VGKNESCLNKIAEFDFKKAEKINAAALSFRYVLYGRPTPHSWVADPSQPVCWSAGAGLQVAYESSFVFYFNLSKIIASETSIEMKQKCKGFQKRMRQGIQRGRRRTKAVRPVGGKPLKQL
jgi:hypothetical protein